MNIRKMINTTEACPECGKDVEIPARGVFRCPECGKIIVPCSSCRECGRNVCAYDEVLQIKDFDEVRLLEIPEFDTIEELEKHYVPYDSHFVSCKNFGEIADNNFYDCAMCKVMSPLQFHMCRDYMKLEKLTDSSNLLFFHNENDAAKFIDYQKTMLVWACNQGDCDDVRLHNEYCESSTEKELLESFSNGYPLQYGLTQKMFEERLEDIAAGVVEYRSQGCDYDCALELAFKENEESWAESVLCPWCGKKIPFDSYIFDYESYDKDTNSVICHCFDCDEDFEVFFGKDNNIIVKVKKVR